MKSFEVIFFSLFGGVLPATLWLWFWLKEDKRHPEPRRRIITTFFLGAIAVPLVLPFQKLVYANFQDSVFITFILWAAIEEIFKFGAAYFGGLHTRDDDEPIDAVMYMVTAALGFVALENTLFLIDPLASGSLLESIITGNLRFVGASLLHVVSSATIGIFIAFSFYKKRSHRLTFTLIGIFFSIVLHTAFNLSIIQSDGKDTFVIFSVLWFTIALLLLFFEKIKKLYVKR